ncbi:glutathione peroxidase [Cryobacterium arcticum]|uniref:Glutathione peroxidase n=1 Tax=Cryobacterium arcticum TaxID=670052 RepID=A0A317ZX55_9MICO|nr:glutathione peroxidase [Cryobacterium arcticum]PXA68747.1 glutathione peroxidase [Cryobacterium arcticum]
MSLRDIPLTDASGQTVTLADYADQVVLIVNVASKCGLTVQYGALEELQKTYAARGFTVLGFPCNQFKGQEPGSLEEILDFCSTTYGVTFPLFDKVEVNGADRHPLYALLTETADADGVAGDVGWNFEKFLVTPSGEVHRFRPATVPDAPEIIDAIEGALSVAA